VATSDGHDQVFADANGTLEENWFSPGNGAVGGWVCSSDAGGELLTLPRRSARVKSKSHAARVVAGARGCVRTTSYCATAFLAES
jgi:hypothetical protein